MSSIDPGVDALQHIGQCMGISNLAFDEEGLCLLEIDERHALVVRQDAEHRRIVLMLEVGVLGAGIAIDVYRTILELNLLQAKEPGPGFGLEPESQSLFLFHCVPYAEADFHTIQQTITKLFEHYQLCVERVPDSAAANSTATGRDVPANFV